jgi:hypothetical protein
MSCKCLMTVAENGDLVLNFERPVMAMPLTQEEALGVADGLIAKVFEMRGGTRTCRECGCTTGDFCPGGCVWVAWDLCSRCAGPWVDEAHPERASLAGRAPAMLEALETIRTRLWDAGGLTTFDLEILAIVDAALGRAGAAA